MINQIKINQKFIKYGWKWKIDEESCLICQQEFVSTCQKCEHPIHCVPCMGACNHIFHLHCVEEWLLTNKNCPMCRSNWDFKKIFKYDPLSDM